MKKKKNRGEARGKRNGGGGEEKAVNIKKNCVAAAIVRLEN